MFFLSLFRREEEAHFGNSGLPCSLEALVPGRNLRDERPLFRVREAPGCVRLGFSLRFHAFLRV